MAITFTCACGREITVKDGLAGRRGKCPACGQVVVVPLPEEPETVVPETQAVEEAVAVPEAEAAPGGETKACRHCHKPIAQAAVFCIHCGTDLRTGKKHASDQKAEGDYDFIKTAPDMVTKPMDAVGTIIEAPATAANFQKALILFAIGTAVFTYAVAKAGTDVPAWWVYLATAALAVVVTVVWGIVAGVTGSVAGQTGVGFANAFMAVIAARAVLGLAMVLAIATFFASPEMSLWTIRLLRVLGGGALMYVIIYRAYDCGHGPAVIAAIASVGLEAILFWLCGTILGNFTVSKVLTLM